MMPVAKPLAAVLCALAGAVVADDTLAPADNAVFTDEFKGRKASDVPTAPEKYRRPKGWAPSAPYPKTLKEIARDHSSETMARAKVRMEKVNAVNRSGKYAATGLGMDRHKCPEWFVDAKLGMFVDWGLYSIAAYSPYAKGARLYPDWYEYKCRPEYTGKDSAADYHRKNWGEDFKPDHFIGLFRGDKFDAKKMMQVFRKCGAKYVVPFLKHHSGFCEWDCSYTFRDTVDSPARRDFAREMADAARAEGLKFGVYNSQADEWEYPILQDDGSIKMKLWGGKIVDWTPDMETKASGKIAVKDFVYDYIVPQMTEFIDKYDPDILWYDADWSTRASENGSFDITAYLYNTAEERKEVCCNDRYGKLDPAEEAALKRRGEKDIASRTIRGDFFTDEWGDTAENIDPKTWHPWESCSGISKAYGNHWMEELDPGMVMTDKEFICHFTTIVARGGNLLLLVNLDGQGAIPKVQEARMLSIGKWLEKNGEAIYGTRIIAPFSTPAVDYTRSKDGKTVYAIVKEPAAEVTLDCVLPKSCSIEVVGSTVSISFRREGERTVVTIPRECAEEKMPFVLRCREDFTRTPWVVLNEDMNNFAIEFTQKNPDKWITREWIGAYADRYLKGPVTHYFVNPQAMMAYYPSKYFESPWGIHERMNGTCVLSEKSAVHDRYTQVIKKMSVEDKIDPYAIFIDRARKRGVAPWLTFRVNDLHDIWYGRDACTLSDRWRNHPEWRRVPGAQMGKSRGFDMGYNYACKEVRDYHLGAFREALERYDVDGVELDWMRFTWILPPGREREDAHFLTEFMRDAKRMIDEVGKLKGRTLGIAVRLPPRPELAREMGYDFETWAREGLMDIVTPCNWWVSVDFAEPIAQWREILRRANPKIRLLAGADDGYSPEGDHLTRRSLTVAERNGWIARCLSEGAEGFYFFNHYGIGRMADAGKMLAEDEAWTLERFVGRLRAYPISYVDRQHYDGKIVNRLLPCTVGERPVSFVIPCGRTPKSPSVAVVVAFESRPRETTLASVCLNGVKATSVAPAPEDFFTTRNRIGKSVLRLTFPGACLKDGENVLSVCGDGCADARLCAGEIEISGVGDGCSG